MSEILQLGQTVHTQISQLPCTINRFLGGGGQGEVYQVGIAGKQMALKWYFPHYLRADENLHDRIERAIKNGKPSERFLWPEELVISHDMDGFGYIMPLRGPSFKSIIDLMKCRTTPSFRALATAGFELSDSFFQLHATGLCYRDISFGNVFFHPDTGSILICDNDNVDVDNELRTGVLGTPRFMAPEVVRGDSRPSTKTDLFSLAVLLFYIFMIHHPLDGKREADIRALDQPAMTKLYGTDPLFIFDPNDDSNRPVPGYQDNAIIFWNMYPEFLRRLFTRAFTEGIRSSGRVQETEWRSVMIQLRDSIIYCPHCRSESFYDLERLRTDSTAQKCWSCGAEIVLPPRIRIGRQTVMLNHDTQLAPHHVDEQRKFDFSQTLASVNPHPTNPNIWGLKNLSEQRWVTTTTDGTVKDVEPEQSVRLSNGIKINFGHSEGEIRQDPA